MRRILHIIDSLDYNGAASQLLVLAKAAIAVGNTMSTCASLGSRMPRARQILPTVGIHTHHDLTPLDTRPARRLATRPPRPPLAARCRPHLEHGPWHVRPDRGTPTVRRRPLPHRPLQTTSLEVGDRAPLRRHASRYITNSDRVQPLARIGTKSPPTKIAVIPTGIEPTRPSDYLATTLLDKLNLPPDARLIGVIGQLDPRKTRQRFDLGRRPAARAAQQAPRCSSSAMARSAPSSKSTLASPAISTTFAS